MNYSYHFRNEYFNYYDDIGLKTTKYNILTKKQSQDEQLDMEYLMNLRPIFDTPMYKGSGKLKVL